MAHENGYLPVTFSTVGDGVVRDFWTMDQKYNPETCTPDTICLGCNNPVLHNGVMFVMHCNVCKSIKEARASVALQINIHYKQTEEG